MRPQTVNSVFIVAGDACPPDAARRKMAEDASNPPYIFAQLRVAYRMERGETPEQVAGIARFVLTSSCRSFNNRE